MSAIDDFDIDDFWAAEDAYSVMIKRFKERAREIAIELGVATEEWFVANIELVCLDEDCEILVDTSLVRSRNAIEKAKNIAEEKLEFQFPMDWLFYDDYQEDLQTVNRLLDEKREREYAEYLRLKEKFESER